MRIKVFGLDLAQDRHARAGILVAITTSSINVNTGCSVTSADWVYFRVLVAGLFALLYDTDLVRSH